MNTYQDTYSAQISKEVQQTPDEYLPLLLELVRLFRQSISLQPAPESFRQGWQEANRGETLPISELWDGLDAR